MTTISSRQYGVDRWLCIRQTKAASRHPHQSNPSTEIVSGRWWVNSGSSRNSISLRLVLAGSTTINYGGEPERIT